MHWTYEEHCPSTDDPLCQGDILDRSEDLLNLFGEVHPHFCDVKYSNFLVLTQSCDLLRRNSQCKTTHINLAVIRSMQDLVSDVLKDKFGYIAPGIYAEEKRNIVEELIARIINQNEHGLGLFYLHSDADVGITVHSASLLRVSISLRANEHYKTLIEARIGRLSQAFQAKLGWMVGNLYSRVAVNDWKDKDATNEPVLKNSLLCFENTKPIWINKKTRKRIESEKIDIKDLPESEIEKLITIYQEPPSKIKVIERVMTLIENNLPKMSQEKLKQFETHLTNDTKLDAIMKKSDKMEPSEVISCAD